MALSTDKNDLLKMINEQEKDLCRINTRIDVMLKVGEKKTLDDLKLEKKILENKIAMLEKILINAK